MIEYLHQVAPLALVVGALAAAICSGMARIGFAIAAIVRETYRGKAEMIRADRETGQSVRTRPPIGRNPEEQDKMPTQDPYSGRRSAMPPMG